MLGGASERFGRDKRLEDVGGQPMYLRALSLLGSVCSHVNLSVSLDQEVLPADVGSAYHVHVVRDKRRVGPLGGMDAVWKERGATQLVLATDLPAVSGYTLERLVQTASESPAEIIVTRAKHSRRIQPLCAVWKAQALSRLETYLDSGGRSVFGMMEAAKIACVDVADDEMININRPGDLDLLPRM